MLLLSKQKGPQANKVNPVFDQIKPPVYPYATTSAGLTYIFDTVEGAPVTSTDSARVYFIPETKFQFGYIEKIYLIAKSIGFNTEEVKHTLNDANQTAVFNDGAQKLEISILNYNFTYEYNLDSLGSTFDRAATPEADTAKQYATDFLTSFDRYPEEIAKGTKNAIFFNYNKDAKAMSILPTNEGANMVEIDLYRADIPGIPADYPIVTSSFHNSQNYVTLIDLGEDKYQVIKAQVKYFEKSEEQVGVYPVITGDQAYEKLKTGRGFIITYTKGETENVVIKKMFFAYFDPDTYQPYMQPLYVFLGDNNFVAYVNALPDNYLLDYSQL